MFDAVLNAFDRHLKYIMTHEMHIQFENFFFFGIHDFDSARDVKLPAWFFGYSSRKLNLLYLKVISNNYN